MDILVGLLIVVLGLAIAFAGLRIFFAILPIAGFVTGFFTGATLITNWLGDGFLATVTGWLTGAVIGILFAIVSYLWWYAGALLAAGGSGALLLSGLFSLFGVNNGTVLTIIAIIGAVAFIILALMLNLPVYVVLINTAILGAHMVVAGLLLVIDYKDLADFDWGVARAIAHENWFWWIVVVVITVAGIMMQLQSVSRVTLPMERWTRVDTEQ